MTSNILLLTKFRFIDLDDLVITAEHNRAIVVSRHEESRELAQNAPDCLYVYSVHKSDSFYTCIIHPKLKDPQYFLL